MKIFILTNVEDLTSNYHPEGGLVIIAETIEAAKELMKGDSEALISEQEWLDVIIHELIGQDIEPNYYIFPNAGCC